MNDEQRVPIPFAAWTELLETHGGLCMTRTRSGKWCQLAIFPQLPKVVFEHEHGTTLSETDWERWMDAVCPVHRRGRWLDAARARRVSLTEWAATQ